MNSPENNEDEEKLAECPANSEEAGRSSVCEGCPGQTLCRMQGGPDPDQEIIDVRMGAIKHKILILSGKGGVGKSTVAYLLSLALAKCQSSKVGVVDLDICGPSIPKLLGVENQPIIQTPYGWKPLVSPNGDIKVMSVASLLDSDKTSVIFRGPRKTGLIKRFLKDTFWGKLDFLICDTPPGTSDEHMSIVKLLKNAKPDGAVLVTTPQEVAMATMRKELNFCKKMGVTVLGLVENMSGLVCPCCKETTEIFPGSGVASLAESYGVPVLGSIPMDPMITECCESGRDPMENYPESPTVQSMMGISNHLISLINR
uniref:Cytosolic Fe-S cluster assembly factor NBP35-like isoform X1 n=2 Tax=Crassostrea virginica TaxID=6565 RepID=A0A8B8DTH2_CRAVI|nr:cytosolic Fe-S cluster assembly factor NBP35-like isoform X1 [Crassostrea virginica]